MRARICVAVLPMALAVLSASTLRAQSESSKPVWETLARAAVPAGVEPILSINSLALPAEPVPRITQPHTHSGPVIAYIVKGEIENQVEPEAPAVHRPGGFFLEPPMHVHKMLRNLSTTEPAMLIVTQVGRTAVPNSLIKPLQEEPVRLLQFHFGEPAPPLRHQFTVPFRSAANQELRLLRLTLPPGADADFTQTGPALVFVLEGTVRTAAISVPVRTHATGDLSFIPVYRAGLSFRSVTRAPAKLLLYQLVDRSSQ